jgi:O-antigen/teichoic acid export membrane protein
MSTPAEREPDLLDTPEAGRRAIRGSLLRGGGYLVGLGLAVGSAAVLFRHLGVVDAGKYVTVLSVVTIAGGLTDAGLTTIGVRELSIRDAASSRAYLRNLLGLRIVLSVVAVVVAAAFAALAGYGTTLVVATLLAGTGVLLQYLSQTFGVALQANLRLGWVTALELVRQAMTAFLIVALVLAGAGLVPLLGVSVPVGIVLVVLTAWLVRHEMPLRPTFHRGQWTILLRQILPVAAGFAVAVIYLRVAVVAMSLVASATQTGYYAAAFRIVEVIAAFPVLMVGTLFPVLARAARDDHVRLRYGLQRSLEGTAILGGLVAVVLAVGAPIAIDIVAGADFDPSVPILRILAFALGILFVTSVFTYTLLSLHRFMEMLYAGLVGLTVSAAGSLILGSLYGGRGAAIAALCAEIVLVSTSAWILLRDAPQLKPDVRFAFKVLGALALAVGLGLLTGLPALVATTLAVVVYLGVLALVRAFPEELVQALLRRPVEQADAP